MRVELHGICVQYIICMCRIDMCVSQRKLGVEAEVAADQEDSLCYGITITDIQGLKVYI